MASASGELLHGRYRIGPVLGEGAMGTVLRAYDEMLCRQVAIKLLKPALARDEQFVARFYAEARALAGLVDRRIVAIHDILADGATHAIVMEYVEGPSLAALLARERRLAEPRAARYAQQIALALAVAHARGVLHRDIKPANVLITSDDDVKVADFGLAKALVPEVDRSLTMTGTVIGSASYFSPEQAQGLPLTAASDLYSLGVVLHELLTGALPFEGTSPVSIAVAHVTAPPPTQAALARSMSRPLAAIVHRLLQKDPAARFGSAAELATALGTVIAPSHGQRFGDAATSVQPNLAPDPEPRHPRRGGAGRLARPLAVIAALLLIAFGGMWALRSRTVALSDVRHIPLARAKATLVALGVTPAVVSRADMTIPAGTVITERPAPGTRVHRGDDVQLVVSNGPPLVTVPDVRGLDPASAERALIGVHLHPDVASRSADSPPNTVIAQDPLAGTTIRAGSRAVLVVSTGPQPPPATDDTETPPPGWIRREWWHLFHHHRHDPGD